MNQRSPLPKGAFALASSLITLSVSMISGSTANAALVGQFGILDLTANGGINPNTGLAWASGDEYRLSFHTSGTIDATSDNPADYDNFATAQAQQNAALTSSLGWTAMVWVNTNASLPQAADFGNIQAGESPISSPLVRGGYGDTTGGAGIGGAGVPVFALDGMTAIARNNADLLNGWSNPFDSDATIRLTGAQTGGQAVHYSPFLDQLGGGDSGVVHGASVWTGGFATPVNPLGDSVDTDSQVRGSWGSSNANSSGRTWNRFQGASSTSLSVYAISPVFTVTETIPEPSSALLGALACLSLLRRRRK